jgi:hypothetical protein
MSVDYISPVFLCVWFVANCTCQMIFFCSIPSEKKKKREQEYYCITRLQKRGKTEANEGQPSTKKIQKKIQPQKKITGQRVVQ